MRSTPFNRDWRLRAPRGPFAAADPTAPPEQIVHLPHDALRDVARTPDAEGATAYWPGGAFTYLKRFDVPSAWAGDAVFLEIEGAQRRSQVFLNDVLVGGRANGYARYFADLGPYLHHGAENELRIEVRVGQDSRWYPGAGLHRPVRLHHGGPVHVVTDGVQIDTVRLEEDQAVVEVRVQVANSDRTTRTVRASLSIDGPGGAPVAATSIPCTLVPGETATVRHRFSLTGAALWSPDQPALHALHVELDGEQGETHRFGIRTVTVDPRKGLRINGEPTLLRGACVHHDNGPLGGAAIGRAEERRIALLREAGFNAVRAAHNPLSSAMLDACDRLGMLVMDEAFDMWTRFKTPDDYSLDFPTWWRDDVSAMVAKDRNHPSVVMYSIGNEIAEVGNPHGARLSRRLADHVRALDPSRPVTNGINALLAVIDELEELLPPGAALNDAGDAFNTIGASDVATNRIEEACATLDVVGFNYAEARYSLDAERFPDRVVVGSETFPSQIGVLWPMVESMPNVLGDFTWTGWDYLGEVGIGATAYAEDRTAVPSLEREYPFLTAWTGDFDITGSRRPVSHYREIVFGLRTEPSIAVRRPAHHGHTITMQSPWAWSDSIASWTWPGHEGAPITVEVAADADDVVLCLDGERVGCAPVGVERPRLAVIETTYRPGTLTAIALRDGAEVGRSVLRTAGTPTLTARADRDTVRADDDDLAFITIELRDEHGTVVTGADTAVTVEVLGSAVLAGMSSGQPKTTERFDSRTWNTFDGRALAVVRPVEAGAAQVVVSSAGHETVTVQIGVEAA